MLLQICFQTLHVLGIHSSLEQSLVTRYQKDMRNLRVWLVFWKKKRNRASGIEENYDLGHRHDAQRLCYEGITCQREMVHAGDAVQQQCRGLCPEPFLWLPLAFEKGPDTVSRLGFLAVLLRLYLCFAETKPLFLVRWWSACILKQPLAGVLLTVRAFWLAA